MYLDPLNDAGSLYRARVNTTPKPYRHPIPQVPNPAESCLGALIEGHLLGGPPPRVQAAIKDNKDYTN